MPNGQHAPTDEELVLQFRDGLLGLDELISSLWNRYHADFLRYAHRQGLLESAEDAVEDTFLVFRQAVPEFIVQGPGCVKGFFYAVLIRRCRQYLRKKKQRERIGGPELDNAPDSHHTEPLDELIAKEFVSVTERMRAALQDCIETLPEPEHSIFVLKLTTDMPWRGIGDTLQKPFNTLRDKYMNALSGIRKCIERKGLMSPW
jgi:RNA polymerase sigma factor (sigma-70 family)